MEDINTIIAGCLNKKRSAQQLLYKRYEGLMFGICLRYIGNKVDAEDVLQEGFVKIFMNIEKYRNEGSFEGWMRKIMINSALTYLRNKVKVVFITQQTDIPDDHHEEIYAEVDIQPSELMKIVRSLPEGSRMVFNLYAIEEYSHKEISVMLGISESTSKSQLSRARKIIAYSIEKLKKNNYVAV
ncbi:MAG: sigma-70 family RNA polymerase sigma factor [Bacteroidetes bacterium]|nr:sigma-70 family RNA polymerase sigma factor [Bacteroidota bacterium]